MQRLTLPMLTNVIYCGDDFAADLERVLLDAELHDCTAVLFTGTRSFAASPYRQALQKLLADRNVRIVHEEAVASNPEKHDIDRTVRIIAELDSPVIIAVGGGSVLDYAKACKLYCQDRSKLVSIYTTIGSGSIVSPFTVYDNHEFKIGDHSEDIVPDVVYVSLQLAAGVPAAALGAGICDIFAHAVESRLSTTATDESRGYADESIQQLAGYLTTGNMERLVLADIYAGSAESIGIVLLPHALGHLVTYRHNVAHGYASFIFMHYFLDYLSAHGIKLPELYGAVFQKVNQRVGPTIAAAVATKAVADSLSPANYALVAHHMDFAFENSPVPFDLNTTIDLYKQSVSSYRPKETT